MISKSSFGEICSNCNFSFGHHGSYTQRCPRKKGVGKFGKFTTMKFRKSLTPTNEVRKVFHIAYLKLLDIDKKKLKGTDKRYVAKMRYMAYFLWVCIPNKKKFLDNWEMPDYNWIRDVENGDLK